GFGRFWARRQHVECPQALSAEPAPDPDSKASPATQPVSFGVAVLIVSLPLILGLIGFGAKLFVDLKLLPKWLTQAPLAKESLPLFLTWLGHSPLAWLQFLGKPTTALLVPTGL